MDVPWAPSYTFYTCLFQRTLLLDWLPTQWVYVKEGGSVCCWLILKNPKAKYLHWHISDVLIGEETMWNCQTSRPVHVPWIQMVHKVSSIRGNFLIFNPFPECENISLKNIESIKVYPNKLSQASATRFKGARAVFKHLSSNFQGKCMGKNIYIYVFIIFWEKLVQVWQIQKIYSSRLNPKQRVWCQGGQIWTSK